MVCVTDEVKDALCTVGAGETRGTTVCLGIMGEEAGMGQDLSWVVLKQGSSLSRADGFSSFCESLSSHLSIFQF